MSIFTNVTTFGFHNLVMEFYFYFLHPKLGYFKTQNKYKFDEKRTLCLDALSSIIT
jgi:hypothetical protein